MYSFDARRQQLASAINLKDRKSTRLNSSHANISYAVFCLKKKNKSISDKDDTDGHSGFELEDNGMRKGRNRQDKGGGQDYEDEAALEPEHVGEKVGSENEA